MPAKAFGKRLTANREKKLWPEAGGGPRRCQKRARSGRPRRGEMERRDAAAPEAEAGEKAPADPGSAGRADRRAGGSHGRKGTGAQGRNGAERRRSRGNRGRGGGASRGRIGEESGQGRRRVPRGELTEAPEDPAREGGPARR